MWILIRVLLVAFAVMPFIEAKSMGLEDLMSALASKSEDDSQDEESPVSDEQLLQFARRSGLVSDPQPDSDSPVNLATALQALQALKRQQSLQVYPAEYAQPIGATTPQQRSARAVNNALPAYDTQKTTVSKSSYTSQPSYSYSSGSDDTQKTAKSSSQYSSQPSYSYSPGSQQTPHQTYSSDATSMKDDRQGHYAYDGHGYEPAAARSPVDHYAHHQPEPYSKVALPIPSVAIKFDPLGLLKLLLQGIPRPLFNLNGKIFLGLELGKNVGLAKGAPPHHPAPHHGGHYGNERVITIG